jgi:N-acyl-D-amino-acid deacylase
MHELVLRDAMVLDGSGADAFAADVAIDDGRISAIGTVGAARSDVDVAGRILAPGFVDTHTHDDGALLRYPDLWFKTSQGVTTVVIGNCGFSAAGSTGSPASRVVLAKGEGWDDLESYRSAVEQAGTAVNAVALIGHNTLRESTLDLEEREASPAELDRMRAGVRAAMDAGAAGISTGLLFAPGKWAAEDELVALAEAAAQRGGLYVTHIREEFADLHPSIEEAIRIGTRAGASVHISHHKAAGSDNWGQVKVSLAAIERHNAAGADVTLDAYPYEAGSGPMAQYFRDGIDLSVAAVMRIATCHDRPDYQGRMLVDIAKDEGRTLLELVEDILAAPRAKETLCLQFLAHEDDIEDNMRHPLVMIGSDGIPELDGLPHPRLLGTFSRVLGEYVRERKVTSLAEMVRRMTSLPAERFGLAERGRIALDHHADLVVVDPASVRDVATYDDPVRASAGIGPVLVGGQIVWDGERPTTARPGRVLHSTRATTAG